MADTLMESHPGEAADLLTDVFAERGVLDEIHKVLTVTHSLIRDELPLNRWSETNPGYALYHRLADTTEHLWDQTQELRDAPQILRELPEPAAPSAATAPSSTSHCAPLTQPEPDAPDRARTAPSASPLPGPPRAAHPAATPNSPRTTC